MQVTYQKQSLTFIGFHTFIDHKKAMNNVPFFGSKATASVLRIFGIP